MWIAFAYSLSLASVHCTTGLMKHKNNLTVLSAVAVFGTFHARTGKHSVTEFFARLIHQLLLYFLPLF